jgi:hypothetical protein
VSFKHIAELIVGGGISEQIISFRMGYLLQFIFSFFSIAVCIKQMFVFLGEVKEHSFA